MRTGMALIESHFHRLSTVGAAEFFATKSLEKQAHLHVYRKMADAKPDVRHTHNKATQSTVQAPNRPKPRNTKHTLVVPHFPQLFTQHLPRSAMTMGLCRSAASGSRSEQQSTSKPKIVLVCVFVKTSSLLRGNCDGVVFDRRDGSLRNVICQMSKRIVKRNGT